MSFSYRLAFSLQMYKLFTIYHLPFIIFSLSPPTKCRDCYAASAAHLCRFGSAPVPVRQRICASSAAHLRHHVGHYAAKTPPNGLGTQKFRAAHVCAKEGEKHRNWRFLHVFRRLQGLKLAHFGLFRGLERRTKPLANILFR